MVATSFRPTLLQTHFCGRHIFQADPASDPVLWSPHLLGRSCFRPSSVFTTSFRQTLLQTEICVRHLSEVLLQTQLYPFFTEVTRTKRETYSSYPFRAESKERILIFTLLYALNVHELTHLIEALPYKPEGRGFNPRWCHWNFSRT